jgi:hypothetical protein
VSLPAADDLFRSTRHTRDTHHRSASAREMGVAPAEAKQAEATSGPPATPAVAAVESRTSEVAARRSSGRVRQEEKMTGYVTAAQLHDIEHARLSLRRDQGLAVDRGRLVREAIAIVLEDLEDHGDDSVLVQRLIGR